MTNDQREHRLDAIRKYSDDLTELARRYDRLRWMAECDEASGAFLDLAESAGTMTLASLQQCGTLLDILWQVQNKQIDDSKTTKGKVTR